MKRIGSTSALGVHLRDWRQSKGLSQAELGRQAGVRQATISGIENATGNASVGTLFRILGALKVTVRLDESAGSGPGSTGGWKEEW